MGIRKVNSFNVFRNISCLTRSSNSMIIMMYAATQECGGIDTCSEKDEEGGGHNPIIVTYITSLTITLYFFTHILPSSAGVRLAV